MIKANPRASRRVSLAQRGLRRLIAKKVAPTTLADKDQATQMLNQYQTDRARASIFLQQRRISSLQRTIDAKKLLQRKLKKRALQKQETMKQKTYLQETADNAGFIR